MSLSRPTHTLLAAVLLTGLAAAPARAATAPIADTPVGQNLALGLSGVSWDVGRERWSAGLELRNTTPLPGASNRFLASARATTRLVELPDLRIAAVGGVQLDPGQVGGRAYVVPDLGLGMAYHFRPWGVPFALRFNVTLTVEQGQGGGGVVPVPYYPDGGVGFGGVQGNWVQRLTLGPNTTASLAFSPNDRYELVLGGGTLIGLRVRY